MRLADKYHALAVNVTTELPVEIKIHIEDLIREAATRGKFEAFYIVPNKWTNMSEAVKKFLTKEGFSYEYNFDYQGKSFRIRF
ncbi:hypothetical protein CkP1_0195 [Citrobacter phage CkP1]|nr:hypothetical protein CkP1_0195 [Citrobacter phage CkP1]